MADWAIQNISQIPDQQSRIYGGTDSYTVADLVQDLRDLTPRGLEFLKHLLGAQKRIGDDARKGLPDEWPDIDGRLHDALVAMFPKPSR